MLANVALPLSSTLAGSPVGRLLAGGHRVRAGLQLINIEQSVFEIVGLFLLPRSCTFGCSPICPFLLSVGPSPSNELGLPMSFVPDVLSSHGHKTLAASWSPSFRPAVLP